MFLLSKSMRILRDLDIRENNISIVFVQNVNVSSCLGISVRDRSNNLSDWAKILLRKKKQIDTNLQFPGQCWTSIAEEKREIQLMIWPVNSRSRL